MKVEEKAIIKLNLDETEINSLDEIILMLSLIENKESKCQLLLNAIMTEVKRDAIEKGKYSTPSIVYDTLAENYEDYPNQFVKELIYILKIFLRIS